MKDVDKERQYTILIIDDNKHDRFMIRKAFSLFQNVRFLEAEAEEEALSFLGEPIDCIFLDFYMPSVVGFELLKQLREAKPDTPIVLCTGTRDVTIARNAVQAGADAYMSKVLLSPKTINRVLHRAFEAASNRAQLKWFRKEIEEFRAELGTVLKSDKDPAS